MTDSSDFYCEHLFAGVRGDPRWLARGDDWEDDVDLELVDVGDVVLPTGELCVCDWNYGFQFNDPNSKAYMNTFVARFCPGQCRFQVCIARYQPGNPREHLQFADYPPDVLDQFFPPDRPPSRDERIALGIIRQSDLEIVRWELADLRAPLTEYRSIERQVELPISAGVVAYLDASLVVKLRQLGRDDPAGIDQIRKDVVDLLAKNNRDTRSWSLYSACGDATPNVALCTTGQGSGSYPSYWGFDAAGNRCCLVTDFHCLYCLDI